MPESSQRERALDFPEVLWKELDAVEKGRELRGTRSAKSAAGTTDRGPGNGNDRPDEPRQGLWRRAAGRVKRSLVEIWEWIKARFSKDAEPDRPAIEHSAAVRRAHAARLVGLSFSGGGIRSATFNLGVLQGLADFGLLKRFDYLSTNSGGGYIGSWLTAWIRRAGLETVEKELAEGRWDEGAAPPGGGRGHQIPSGKEIPPDPAAVAAAPGGGAALEGREEGRGNDEKPKDESQGSGEGTGGAGDQGGQEKGAVRGRWAEAEPLVWLRRFSNYLTPQVGFFSADTWTVVATYLRNLLLNLSVLVLALGGLLLVPHAVTYLMGQMTKRWALGLGIVFLLLGIVFIACNLAGPRAAKQEAARKGAKPEHPWYMLQGWVQVAVVVPLFAAAACSAVWLWQEGPAAVDRSLVEGGLRGVPEVLRWGLPALLLYLLAWLFGFVVHWGVSRRRPAANLEEEREQTGLKLWLRLWLILILSAVIAGAIGGILLWLPYRFFAGLPGVEDRLLLPVVTLSGAPLLVLVIILTAVVHVGLMGRAFPERQRQWWSRLGAWLLIYSIAWLGLLGIAFYGPVLVLWLGAWLGVWAQTTLGVGWLASTVGGVLAGRGAAAGNGAPGPGRRLVMALAPPVFVLGLLMLLALGVHRILFQVYGEGGGGAFWSPAAGGLAEIARQHLGFIAGAVEDMGRWSLLWPLVALTAALVLSHRVDINQFSMHLFYRNRLIRAYLGASNRERRSQPFTGFDPADDLALARLSPWRTEPRQGLGDSEVPSGCYDGPYPLLNTALNLVSGKELAWQQRRAASFLFSPLYSGYQVHGDGQPRAPGTGRRLEPFGYRPTADYEQLGNCLSLGTAAAISGAAVSPSMGFRTTAAMAFLLTVFNVRLGWWLGNPRHRGTWRKMGPNFGIVSLLAELFGKTGDESRFVYLSDGGHFENLGLYELVRRRCRFIVATDAGADPKLTFEDLANALRKCRVDFGVDIEIDVERLRLEAESRRSRWHCAVGCIRYDRVDPGAFPGTLLYIKTSLTGDEPRDLLNYAAENPAFPHQSTGDQFFDEAQFESYRKLGRHIVEKVLGAVLEEPEDGRAREDQLERGRTEALTVDLEEAWYPPSSASEGNFTRLTETVDAIFERLRTEEKLEFLHRDIYPEWRVLMQGTVPLAGGKEPGKAAPPPGGSPVAAAPAVGEPAADAVPSAGEPQADAAPSVGKPEGGGAGAPPSATGGGKDGSGAEGEPAVSGPGSWLPRDPEARRQGFYFCNSLIQLMENVYLDLGLEREWNHPDNRGWMNIFKHWSWAGMFRAAWAVSAATYGARFQHFCERRLGLRLGKVEVRALVEDLETLDEEALKKLEEEEKLNFLEADLVREFLTCNPPDSPLETRQLRVLELVVQDPRVEGVDGEKATATALRFPFGFCLTTRPAGATQEGEILYFRIQDHLRKMRLAREALKELVPGFRQVRPVAPREGREPGEKPQVELPEWAWKTPGEAQVRVFRALFESVCNEVPPGRGAAAGAGGGPKPA